MNTTAIILAGGKSSRMGTNKALLQLNGKTVIEGMVEKLENIVDDIIIVTNTFEDYAFLHLPMIEDKRKGYGATCWNGGRFSCNENGTESDRCL